MNTRFLIIIFFVGAMLLGCREKPSHQPSLNTQTGLPQDPSSDPNDNDTPFKTGSRALNDTVRELQKLPVSYILLGDGHRCTGVLVSSRVILTAAHCFFDTEKVFTKPQGAHVLSKNGHWVNVAISDFFQRADNETWEFKDIALIRLVDEVDPAIAEPISIGIRPDPFIFELKSDVTLHSYGFITRQWIPRIPQKIFVEHQEIESLARRWVLPTVHARASAGDSGGPIVGKVDEQWVLFGVLQGEKGTFYSRNRAITYTWADSFISKILDAQGDSNAAKQIPLPETLFDPI